jgi:selenocysteine lyase/cysteine desulfurase
MIDRRNFLVSGAAGLAALSSARAAVARELDRLPRAHGALEPDVLAGEYMLDPRITYLNHASIGTTPRVVHDAHVRYLQVCETNPHEHIWESAWTAAVREARAKAASFLNCTIDEVAFTHNTTEAFSLLAQGLPLKRRDEVLFSSLNHLSASQAWRYYGDRKGYKVRTFDIPPERIAELDADGVVDLYIQQITSATRVLVFPEVDNIVGLRHPVARLAAKARARGVEFIAVDGAQILGMLPVDVSAVDFYAASPHKWLQAPKGLGLLFVRTAVQPRLSPMWVKHARVDLPATAEVFEDYGTRNTPEVLTLGDAMDFQRALGIPERTRRHQELRKLYQAGVKQTERLEWRSPEREELGCSLIAIQPAGRDARVVQQKLQAEGIIVRAFGPPWNVLRVSPNLMTTEEQTVRFFNSVRAS